MIYDIIVVAQDKHISGMILLIDFETRGPWGHIAYLSNNGSSKDIVPFDPSVE